MAELGEPSVQQEEEIDTGTDGHSQEASASNSDTGTEASPQEARVSTSNVVEQIGNREEDMSDSADENEDYEDYYESEEDSYGEEDVFTPAEAELRRFNLELRKKREKDFWKYKNEGNISTRIFNNALYLLHMTGDNRKLRRTALRLMKGKIVRNWLPRRGARTKLSTAEASVPKKVNTADDSSEESDLDMKAFLPHPYPLRHRRLPRGRIRIYQGLTYSNLTPVTLNGVLNVIPENLQQTFAMSDWIETIRH